MNYPEGNEYKLFVKADLGFIEILIPDYVYEETKLVFERKNIDSKLINGFLETFHNIHLIEVNIAEEHELIALAKRFVQDRKDRPIFVVAKKIMERDKTTFLVSGDEDLLTEKVNNELYGRVKRTVQMLRLL